MKSEQISIQEIYEVIRARVTAYALTVGRTPVLVMPALNSIRDLLCFYLTTKMPGSLLNATSCRG